MTHVDYVRQRVRLALAGGDACPACGYRELTPMTARDLARKSGVKPGVIRRFSKGGDILASNLTKLDEHTLGVTEAWPDEVH